VGLVAEGDEESLEVSAARQSRDELEILSFALSSE